jgi:hypothetical protein
LNLVRRSATPEHQGRKSPFLLDFGIRAEMADDSRVTLRLQLAGMGTVRAARLRRFGLLADETSAAEEFAVTIAGAERRGFRPNDSGEFAAALAAVVPGLDCGPFDHRSTLPLVEGRVATRGGKPCKTTAGSDWGCQLKALSGNDYAIFALILINRIRQPLFDGGLLADRVAGLSILPLFATAIWLLAMPRPEQSCRDRSVDRSAGVRHGSVVCGSDGNSTHADRTILAAGPATTLTPSRTQVSRSRAYRCATISFELRAVPLSKRCRGLIGTFAEVEQR